MFLRFKPILPSSLVSDSRSLLEAFWILSLISLGRLENLHLSLLICVWIFISIVYDLSPFFKPTPKFLWRWVYRCFDFSCSLSFFLFFSIFFLLISLCADLALPLVCPSLPSWDITLLTLPGENIPFSRPGMWAWLLDNCAGRRFTPAPRRMCMCLPGHCACS